MIENDYMQQMHVKVIASLTRFGNTELPAVHGCHGSYNFLKNINLKFEVM